MPKLVTAETRIAGAAKHLTRTVDGLHQVLNYFR